MKQSVLNYSSGYHLFPSPACRHKKKKKNPQKNPKPNLFIQVEQKPQFIWLPQKLLQNKSLKFMLGLTFPHTHLFKLIFAERPGITHKKD